MVLIQMSSSDFDQYLMAYQENGQNYAGISNLNQMMYQPFNVEAQNLPMYSSGYKQLTTMQQANYNCKSAKDIMNQMESPYKLDPGETTQKRQSFFGKRFNVPVERDPRIAFACDAPIVIDECCMENRNVTVTEMCDENTLPEFNLVESMSLPQCLLPLQSNTSVETSLNLSGFEDPDLSDFFKEVSDIDQGIPLIEEAIMTLCPNESDYQFTLNDFEMIESPSFNELSNLDVVKHLNEPKEKIEDIGVSMDVTKTTQVLNSPKETTKRRRGRPRKVQSESVLENIQVSSKISDLDFSNLKCKIESHEKIHRTISEVSESRSSNQEYSLMRPQEGKGRKRTREGYDIGEDPYYEDVTQVSDILSVTSSNSCRESEMRIKNNESSRNSRKKQKKQFEKMKQDNQVQEKTFKTKNGRAANLGKAFALLIRGIIECMKL